MYTLNYFSQAGQGSGYGGSAEHIAIALERSGNFDVYMAQLDAGKKNRKWLKESEKIRNKTFRLGEIGMVYGVPSFFLILEKLPYKFKVGFTMFETSKLPRGKNWFCGKEKRVYKAVNKYLDLLLVPSKHNKEIFIEDGVTVPIEVVNLGIEPTLYEDMTPLRRERRKRSKTMVFLMAGHLTGRKDPGTTVAAFMKAFGTKKEQEKNGIDVKLILKTVLGTHKHFEFPDYNIQIIDAEVSPKTMKAIYANADCFVFPSRGEGFGLTPLEAMATGLYVILPSHTGMAEYVNEELNGVLHNITEQKAINYPWDFGDVGNWYQCDVDELAEKMKWAYKNKEKVYELGEKSVNYARQFSYDRTAEMIYNAIKKYYND